MPVELSYDVNFKWHMPIRVEICRAEQKYMPFFGTVTERDFREKIQNAGRSPSAFYGKNPERSVATFVYVSVLWIFSGNRARLRSQKMAYIFVQHGIFPHILAYAISNKHHKKA